MKLKSIAKVLVPSALLIAFGVLLAYDFFTKQQEIDIPTSFAGLTLMKKITGGEAREYINKLHGKGVTPQGNVVGLYSGEEGNATLYVSLFGSQDEASEVDKRMRALLERGHPIFGHYRLLEIDGNEVSFCLGQDQVHYFLSAGDKVFWLEVDAPYAAMTIRDLLAFIKGSKPPRQKMS